MTVSELINILRGMPQDAMVMAGSFDGYGSWIVHDSEVRVAKMKNVWKEGLYDDAGDDAPESETIKSVIIGRG